MACNSSGGKGGKSGSANKGGKVGADGRFVDRMTPQELQNRKDIMTPYLETVGSYDSWIQTSDTQKNPVAEAAYKVQREMWSVMNSKDALELMEYIQHQNSRIMSERSERNRQMGKKVINSDLGQFLGKTMSRKG